MEPMKETDLDLYELTRQLDKCKSEVFMGNYVANNRAAFFGPLMCSMNFIWTEDLKTAATDGINIYWNPHWFLRLEPRTRHFVLVHELWHAARLHQVRLGDRDPLIWNYACDLRINNDLHKEGYTWKGMGFDPWFDQLGINLDNMPEEDIYDKIIQMGEEVPESPWGNEEIPGDIIPELSDDEKHDAVGNVVRAIHEAKDSGHGGDIPGDTEIILKQFLSPVVPWEILLNRFFQELMSAGHTWTKRNRRFPDIYMPARFKDEGRLEHLMYFQDTSGSISNADNTRFNSEIKYIKETYNPKKLTIVQFDTIIQSVTVLTEYDDFNEVEIKGRGGTDLRCVREYIIKQKPTCAVVFSDMCVVPMEPLPFDVPMIWVAIRNHGFTVPHGEVVYIKG